MVSQIILLLQVADQADDEVDGGVQEDCSQDEENALNQVDTVQVEDAVFVETLLAGDKVCK